MNKIIRYIILISVINILLVGCASIPTAENSSKRSFVPGRVVENKKAESVVDRIRVANELQIQDYEKGKSVAYSQVHGNLGLFTSLSQDQRDIVILEGSPNYIRQFRNVRGNQIAEWLYEEKNYQIQFKDGKVVYCAPISQQAKMILDYGQPTNIFVQQMAGGQQHEFFWYRNPDKMIVFSKGKLIIAQ